MATRPLRGAGRDAVERARIRMPGLVPTSTEVVELVRGVPYVVVRTLPAGIVVLDGRGRVVRRRELLAAIARHLHAVGWLAATVEEARLERRREHAARSVELLTPVTAARVLVARLEELLGRIDAVLAAAEGGVAPTERTLRRRIAQVNEAARADRLVVREARLLGARLGTAARGRAARDDALGRWVVGRLASSDLPFVHPELDETESACFVERFLRAVRR